MIRVFIVCLFFLNWAGIVKGNPLEFLHVPMLFFVFDDTALSIPGFKIRSKIKRTNPSRGLNHHATLNANSPTVLLKSIKRAKVYEYVLSGLRL